MSLPKKICVVGLGYMGLPFSCLLAKAGFEVIGYDLNKKRVDDVNNAICPFNEKGLAELLKEAVLSKKLKASTSIAEANVFLISVPTPHTKDNKADLSYVKSAAEKISTVLKKGNLVILESTVPPRTCRNLIIPILNKAKVSYHLAHCPERAIPGNTLYELVNNDRIIGGYTKESALLAKEIYSKVVKGNIYLTDDITAEAVKLMENTFRDVNIALANEFAKISSEIGINVWEAISLANKHPRVNILSPGPGVGGHCIAIDPWFLVENSKTARLIPLARQINDSMPEYVSSIAKNILKSVKNPKITLLGVAYKKDVDDARETPALKIIENLSKYNLSLTDPYVKEFPFKLSSFSDAIKDSDCIIIVTDHSEYKNLKPSDLSSMRTKIIIDTRNCINHKLFIDAGFKVVLLGGNK